MMSFVLEWTAFDGKTPVIKVWEVCIIYLLRCHEQDVTQGQIFRRMITCSKSEFSFSLACCLIYAIHSWIFSHCQRKPRWIHYFLRVSERRETFLFKGIQARWNRGFDLCVKSTFRCHYSQVNFDSELQYLLKSYLWIKLIYFR